MTKLSEKLANASVDDASKLITELAVLSWGDDPNNHDDDYLIKWGPFKALIAIGPEGWLSAVMMLVPEGYGLNRQQLRSYNPVWYGLRNDFHPKLFSAKHEIESLALASAIAQTMENDDA